MNHTRPPGEALARVSVAVPTLDRPGLLVRALSSVLDQRHGELEVTVVDNGSGPETRAVLAAVDDPRVDVVRHHQTVPRTDNYNVALNAGTAPYVAVLADDDEWTPEFLERAVAVLQARAAVVLVHTGYEVVDLEGEVLYSVPDPSPGPEADVMSGSDYIRWMLDGSRRTQFTGTVLRRSALPPRGFLAEDDVSDDLGLLLRAALRGDVAFVREPLVRVRFHEGTVTARASSGPVTSGYRLGLEHRTQCRDVKLRFLDEHGERLANARQLRQVAHRSFRRHLLVPAARRAVEGAGPVEVLRTAVADVRRDPWCLLDRQTWKWSVAAYREGRRGR